MRVKRPNKRDLQRIAKDLGFTLDADELGRYQELLKDAFASYDRIDALTAPPSAPKYPRGPISAPAPAANPHHAWYRKVTVKGAPAGPLAGRTLAVKDNICLAGVPMMNGARVLDGYVPDEDATVVTRILDAGGTIVGKTTCENLCLSGGSFTSDPHPVDNPHKRGYSAGGSSSGSAVVVCLGEADMALGGDQGGSIRIPASWTGVYGLKPTHGLVPYTGVFPIELTLDHCGPMARTVADIALLLSVIAGPDGKDPRQAGSAPQDYAAALTRGARGLRIGLLREGFGRPESENVVDSRVRAAARQFEALGATVSDVSIPMHLDGPHIWNAIGFEGVHRMMMQGSSHGSGWNGHYTSSLVDYFGRGWRAMPDALSKTTKFVMLAGEYMQRRHPNVYYARAQNLGNLLRAAYDRALESVDVLVLPTLPMRAQPNISPDAPPAEYVGKAFEMLGNTCPTDITHHPAMNVPCGLADGLPIGMMLVGRRHDDATVIQAAAAFESLGDWKAM